MVKKPQNFLALFLAVLIGGYGFLLFTHPVYSDEATDLENQINQKNQELADKQTTLSQVEARIKEISGSNYSVSQKIALINEEISKLDASIAANTDALNTKIKEIEDKQTLMEQKKVEMDQLSTDLYMQSRYRMATFFLSGRDWDILVKEFFLKQSSIAVLKTEVEQINGEFSSLEESRALLETEKANLEAQKKDMDDSYALLAAEKAKLQSELSSQYASKSSLTKTIGSLSKEISQLQQYLLTVKSGGTVVNANSVPQSSSDPQSSQQYFLSNAPSGSFAVFSYGAYTWRHGMSQWGAKARAAAGQSYQTILSAYYPGTTMVSDTMSTITVRSCNRNGASCSVCNNPTYATYSFEDYYMKKIAEMPDDFGPEALKAQAIATRTYALKATNYGAEAIDDDECDQVFNQSVNKPNWEAAVAATRGVVLASGGVLANTSYAAVHGGYSYDMGWDTTSGNGGYLNWEADAWESKSGVSWFYKNWFRKGYSLSGNNCGRNPWLTNSEMADILNAYLRWTQVSSDSRIVAIDTTSCWGQAANPYSIAQLQAVVSNPVTYVYSAVVTNSNGTTTNVSFNTNRGIINIPGADFKTVFNMRAPGAVRIPQNGSIVNINIEYK